MDNLNYNGAATAKTLQPKRVYDMDDYANANNPIVYRDEENWLNASNAGVEAAINMINAAPKSKKFYPGLLRKAYRAAHKSRRSFTIDDSKRLIAAMTAGCDGKTVKAGEKKRCLKYVTRKTDNILKFSAISSTGKDVPDPEVDLPDSAVDPDTGEILNNAAGTGASMKKSNTLLYVGIGALVLIGGIIVYKKFIQKPA